MLLAWPGAFPGIRAVPCLSGFQIIGAPPQVRFELRSLMDSEPRIQDAYDSLEYQGRGADSDRPVERLQCVVPLQAYDEEMLKYR